ncbi:MAG: transposase [Deltaproteobacteria bacterium]|jgi:transposase-like protein
MTNKTPRPRRSWPKAEKARIAQLVRRRRAAGARFRELVDELGIQEGSLRLWLKQYPEAALQPVEIVEEPLPIDRPIALVTPDGFRFEGIELAIAVRLWERLR